MEFRNLTPFSALNYFMLDKEQREYHVVAMKVGYQLQQCSGSEYRMSVIDKDVIPLCLEDKYRGAVNASQVLRESDLAPLKPRCDVIINGIACAPGGIACEQFPVSVRLVTPNGNLLLDKTLLIRGESEFERVNPYTPFMHWRQTPLRPFTELELDYCHAFGGECRIDEGDESIDRIIREKRLTEEQRREHPDHITPPVAHTVHMGNPLGCGYTEHWYQNATDRKSYAAPRIVDAHHPFTDDHFTQLVNGSADLSQLPFQPAGLGIIGRAWKPRLSLAGTYDQQWLEERHPYLPDDFDFGYWNAAPIDQQIAFPAPESRFELMNLTHDGLVTFSLPNHFSFILLRMSDGELLPQPMQADTLVIDTQLMQMWMTYRYVLPVESSVRVMELRYETQPGLLQKKLYPQWEV
ncbi:DUF2169 domain-containing protein [Enterobacter cloacae]|uniref:DUF2169 family type VI secretion system accessory protein n=1 Tax=Enterobacter TaxID=547 RepID=UPI000D1D3614|nr:MULTISPECIES: DUF2169 domain-containing protein [Enterobacter]RAY64614.1 DUF2169 domain-containing protein [Enterobacter hormaechei]MBJ6386314.1 DUF2169 domain-containing protein [Enterobacter cloacae]MBJ6405025.1 DUF2169 domain-containing protein [Enterobacter cloacae]MBJ6435601.1 DUF2169 domain-containing protein [Enterobacter cloacae]MBJ6458810.1 DUF2169 domain-containing protein [Enterobacter cloacae]